MCALAKGEVYIDASYCQVAIQYREHDSRNGCMMTDVSGHPLDARNLRELASLLEAEEEKLKLGRERYQRMFDTMQAMGDLGDPEDEEDDGLGRN